MPWRENNVVCMKATHSTTGSSLYWWTYTLKICAKESRSNWTWKKATSGRKYFMCSTSDAEEVKIFWSGNCPESTTWWQRISVRNVSSSMREDGRILDSRTDYIPQWRISKSLICSLRLSTVIMTWYRPNFVSITCLAHKRTSELDSTRYFQTFWSGASL